MPYRVEIDKMTFVEWTGLMELFEDANIYQTWAYGAVRWKPQNLSHLVLKRDNEVISIAQLRIVRLGKLKCGIAYLRWGPLCHRKGKELDAEVVQRMASALHDEYVVKRRLFLRILPNAFVGSPRAEVFRNAFSRFSSEPASHGNGYRTFLLDLSPPLDVLRKQLDQKWRNQLNRAEKNDLKIVEGSGPEEYQEFAGIYREMWARKKFETSVDVDEFGRLQERLSEKERMKVLICCQDDKPVAGVVCSAMGNSAIYLLGATNDRGLKAKGAYLLHWAMIKWLKVNGLRYYDLGGIDPQSNPGVHHFKSGFSGEEVSHLSPLVACNNMFGSAFAKAAELVRSQLRDRIRHRRRSRMPEKIERSEALP